MKKESCRPGATLVMPAKAIFISKTLNVVQNLREMFMVCINTATVTLIVARVLASVQSQLLMFAQSNRLKIALYTATW